MRLSVGDAFICIYPGPSDVSLCIVYVIMFVMLSLCHFQISGPSTLIKMNFGPLTKKCVHPWLSWCLPKWSTALARGCGQLLSMKKQPETCFTTSTGQLFRSRQQQKAIRSKRWMIRIWREYRSWILSTCIIPWTSIRTYLSIKIEVLNDNVHYANLIG